MKRLLIIPLTLLSACSNITIPGSQEIKTDLTPAPVDSISGLVRTGIEDMSLNLPAQSEPAVAKIQPPNEQGQPNSLTRQFVLPLPALNISELPRWEDDLAAQGCTNRLKGGSFARLAFVEQLDSTAGTVRGRSVVIKSGNGTLPTEGTDQTPAYIFSDRDTKIQGDMTCEVNGLPVRTRYDLNLYKGWNRASVIQKNGQLDRFMYSTYVPQGQVDFWQVQ